jgi:hypothetical protein
MNLQIRVKRTKMAGHRFQALASLIMFGAVGIMLGTSRPGYCQEPDRISLEMTVTYKGGVKHTVEITLLNKNKQTIELFEAQLPWRYHHSMTLVLAKNDGTSQTLAFTPSGIIDDPSPTVIKLTPNKMLKGTINLKEWYPKIDAVLADCGIDVFYAYQADPLGGKLGQRTGGWFSIPQTTHKSVGDKRN